MKSVRIVFISVFALVWFSQPVSANEALENSLATADSLFQARKYTQSFELYEYFLKEQKVSSPAMLLRMSFIKEGLGDYSQSLYYLNLYYLQTADRKVLSKMESLAERHGLEGYKFNDWEFIQAFFYKYFFHLVLFLLVLSVLLITTMYYQKFKKQQSPSVAAFFMVISLGLLYYTLNYGRNYEKSLVGQNSTYVMSGPSAGAEVIAIIDKGHRLDTKSKTDVWTEITWKEQSGYIKSDKLLPITF